MKKHVIEYMDNGINYTMKTFADYTGVLKFSDCVCRKE